MATGMHTPLIHRCIRKFCLFLYRQCIHLCSEDYQSFPDFQGWKFRYKTRRFHRSNLISQFFQIYPDKRRSFYLLKCQLRMLVKVTPETEQFLCIMSNIHIASCNILINTYDDQIYLSFNQVK